MQIPLCILTLCGKGIHGFIRTRVIGMAKTNPVAVLMRGNVPKVHLTRFSAIRIGTPSEIDVIIELVVLDNLAVFWTATPDTPDVGHGNDVRLRNIAEGDFVKYFRKLLADR